MSVHMFNEIVKLKSMIETLSAKVEDAVSCSVTAIVKKDKALAESVINGDDAIDAYEVEVEEECLKILSLHQPVASDLRLIIAILKVNDSLERIGDLAVHMAEAAVALADQNAVNFPYDVVAMADRAKEMVKKSLDSLFDGTIEVAEEVIELDTKIDRMHRSNYSTVTEMIQKHPENTRTYLYIQHVSRNLERIADHATYIAEDVLYMLKGEIVRHKT